ncbi:PEP-CTERM sorting domain-containing protein [bacterium]|nr:PEP-CTERM sorting domain-containing protein [bacterium]
MTDKVVLSARSDFIGEEMNRLLSFGIGVGTIALAQSALAVNVFGLTDRDQLVRFDSSSPMQLNQSVFISGLMSNESLVGIDFRPSNGRLYGLGSFGNVYTLNTQTGAATFQNSLFNQANGQALSLSGSEFGIDFNPAADRLRVVSNLGQNLRINVDSGLTFVDGMLNQGSGNPHVIGTAYTNNDNNPATGTTQYTVDSMSDVLNIQNPPNSGTQVLVGSLGVDVTALGDIDVLTDGTLNTMYGVFQLPTAAGSQFGMVNLSTGSLSLLGSVGSAQSNNSIALRGLAVEAVPEPATMTVLGIAALVALARKRRV